MVSNQFFVKKGPFPLKELIKTIDCVGDFSKVSNFDIYGVESLVDAKENDMTFLNSSKYKEVSIKTKAAVCITSSNFSKFLPKKCIKLNVKNILLAVTQISKKFYPKADLDYPDINLKDSSEIKNKYPDVIFGKNVLIGDNVQIDKNTFIGSNCVIESNVKIEHIRKLMSRRAIVVARWKRAALVVSSINNFASFALDSNQFNPSTRASAPASLAAALRQQQGINRDSVKEVSKEEENEITPSPET